MDMPSDIKLKVIDGNDIFVKLEYEATESNMGIPEMLMDGHDCYNDSPRLLNELMAKLNFDTGEEKELCEVM
jgi:hypothetical protein